MSRQRPALEKLVRRLGRKGTRTYTGENNSPEEDRVRSICLSLWILAAALGASESPSNSQTHAHDDLELWDLAADAYRAEDADRAIELLQQVVERTPDRAEAWRALSRAYEWSGNLKEAIEAGESARALGGYGGSLLAYRLAQLHAEAGHSGPALDWLEVALHERFENRPRIAGDEAFAALADEARFQKLAGILPTNLTSRTQRWLFDLAYLVEEAERMHADPARPAFAPPFRNAAAQLKNEIPALNDDQIYLRMMKLVALLDDGHSAIYQPAGNSPLESNPRSLPLRFHIFPEGLYIVDGIDSWAELAGHRVLRFGDLEAEYVLQEMSAYRGVDNPMTWRWMGPQFFVGRLVLLHAVGASPDGKAVKLTLESPEGERTIREIPGGNYPLQRKLRPSPATAEQPPLWLSDIDTNFWLKPMHETHALYFQFNRVRDGEAETIAEFAERLRAAAANEGVRNLIVDVRHNGGGNNSLVRPLVRALVEFELRGDGREIYILTGRHTFSAAQNFINQVEKWTDAKFIGEPSASSPNFVGEETNLRLPYSQLIGSISTQYWQDSSPNDTRLWIPIDLPVELSAADYFAGRDPVLEAVLRRIAPVQQPKG